MAEEVKPNVLKRFITDILDLDDIPGKLRKFYKNEVVPFIKDGLNKSGKSLIDSFTHTESEAPQSTANKFAWSPYRTTQTNPQAQASSKTQPDPTIYFNEIEYETEGKAQRVLDDMIDYLHTHPDGVSVAFMYDVSEVRNTNYNMTVFGWTDENELRRPAAYVQRKLNGKYRINLPKAHSLKTR